MTEAITLQQILKRFLPTENIDTHRLKVCQQLQACRTESLGGMRWQCDECGKEVVRYHSCRNRHCPQCQGRATHQWAERQQAQILPVTYFHLVFTLPDSLNGWISLHPETLYRLLFRAVWQTLKHFGEDPKRLNGQLGMSAILHTWGQNLSRHVHLHCLIPGGALTTQGEWHRSKSNYLFPVKALSRYYRGTMVSLLRDAYQSHELSRIRDKEEVEQQLNRLMEKEWVVYSKAALNRTETVVSYLARYTHRIAISNHRIQGIHDGHVMIRYKDYREHGKNRSLSLSGEEFVRRYLMHIVAKGFMRIRHYGFLANCCRKKRLEQIRQRLHCQPFAFEDSQTRQAAVTCPCPRCKKGDMILIAEILPTYGNQRLIRRR